MEHTKPQEKKYRVSSFTSVYAFLQSQHSPKIQTIDSTHYYGDHEGNDVEKFVEYADRCEIHILKENDGKFTLIEHRQIPGKQEGLAWLRERGHTTASIVRMQYEEYAYKGGTVGLYTINNSLLSVILYYPPGMLDAVEKDLNLQDAEVIRVPYNIYLMMLGLAVSVQL